MSAPSRLCILYVGMSAQTVEILSGVLRKGGFNLQTEQLADTQQLASVLNCRFDVVLIDTPPHHSRSIDRIHRLLVEKSWDIPVLVYSSEDNEGAIVAAMKAGANDFISSQNPQRVLSSVKRELLSVQQRAALHQQARADALLQEIDSLMLQGWDVVPLVEKICQHVAELFDLKLVWIGGKQGDGSVSVVAAAGCVDYLKQITVRWDNSPLAGGPAGAAIKKKQPVALLVDAPEFAPWRRAAGRYGIHSTLALPLVAWGESIGVLVMYSARRDAFDAASVKRYVVFANRLSITLLGAQEHQQFRLLSAAMSKATQAIFITKYDGTIIWFNQALSNMSGYSPQEIMDSKPHMFSSGSYEKEFWKNMWSTILQGKIWTGDLLNRRKDGTLYSVLQSITPLYDEQGKIINFLCLQQDISEKKELERKIEYLAYHDVLTGLPNRTLFNDRVQQAISQAKRDKTEFSLLFVDLDGFKEVNDTHGHAAGDQLLKMVAERLRACVREGDTVARLGGDEFIVLLRDLSADQGLRNVARKIIEHIARPYELDACSVNITASIGISRYPGDAVLAEKLMSCADEAMYSAKHAGKNGYAMWRIPMQLAGFLDWQI
ncbi:MAG: diguanylate cyclase [Gallionella sp.]|nr:diguanylate cyclase [Gallionella sp.]